MTWIPLSLSVQVGAIQSSASDPCVTESVSQASAVEEVEESTSSQPSRRLTRIRAQPHPIHIGGSRLSSDLQPSRSTV